MGKPDPRELFDSILADAVEEDRGTRHPTTREPMAFNPRQVRLTKAQSDLLREAERRRGLLGAKERGATYLHCAVLAFVAYDLGLSFQEVLSGVPLPDDPEELAEILSLSERVRGSWNVEG